MNRGSTPTIFEKVLAPRELEILSLAALGFKSKNIAEILFVSVATIKKTLANTYLKLNAKNKTNAVAIAILNNMLDINMINHVAAKYKIDVKKHLVLANY